MYHVPPVLAGHSDKADFAVSTFIGPPPALDFGEGFARTLRF